MYLTPVIEKAFSENKHRFIGSNSHSAIIRRLGMSFEFPKDLKFRVEKFKDIDSNEFTVSGLFDMTTNKKYVILNVAEVDDELNLNEDTYEQFKFLVSQTIQHESIHQLQWQYREEIDDPVKLDFRNFAGTLDEEREYLSDIDEIDAYAHDIAMEIRFFYPKENPFKVLKRINRAKKIPSFLYYKNIFYKCEWHKIKKQLLSKTYKWIPHV